MSNKVVLFYTIVQCYIRLEEVSTEDRGVIYLFVDKKCVGPSYVVYIKHAPYLS